MLSDCITLGTCEALGSSLKPYLIGNHLVREETWLILTSNNPSPRLGTQQTTEITQPTGTKDARLSDDVRVVPFVRGALDFSFLKLTLHSSQPFPYLPLSVHHYFSPSLSASR